MKKLLLLTLTLTFALGAVAKPKKVVMIAGRQSHGPLSHEHKAGIMLLAKCLQENAGDLVAPTVVLNGWPKDNNVFRDVAAVVIYSDGGGRHPAHRGRGGACRTTRVPRRCTVGACTVYRVRLCLSVSRRLQACYAR